MANFSTAGNLAKFLPYMQMILSIPYQMRTFPKFNAHAIHVGMCTMIRTSPKMKNIRYKYRYRPLSPKNLPQASMHKQITFRQKSPVS